MTTTTTAHPKIVSRAEWLAARKAFLAKEKAFTRQRDAHNAERRRLPMVRIDKNYTFDGPSGKASLIDLFQGRSQLIVYHFMFDPADPPPGKEAPWSEGCPGCSRMVDNLPHLAHLYARNTSLVLISRAPMSKITPFKKRMGWTYPWYSSFGTEFNYDFHVTVDESVRPVEYNYVTKAELAAKGQDYHITGEQPGFSAFLRVGNDIFHTYSTYSRGLDMFLVDDHLLDMTAYGRQEDWEDSPEGWPQTPKFEWWRHHDKYDFSTCEDKSCCN